MPTVEERLALLEARVDATGDMTMMTDLRADMNRQFADVNRQFIELREDLNRRFAAIDQRFTAIDRRLGTIDQKGDRHFLYPDQKFDRRFTWIVGTQIAVLLAVVGALVGAYFR